MANLGSKRGKHLIFFNSWWKEVLHLWCGIVSCYFFFFFLLSGNDSILVKNMTRYTILYELRRNGTRRDRDKKGRKDWLKLTRGQFLKIFSTYSARWISLCASIFWGHSGPSDKRHFVRICNTSFRKNTRNTRSFFAEKKAARSRGRRWTFVCAVHARLIPTWFRRDWF